MQSWDTWLKQWKLHSRLSSFRRKLDQARRYLDKTPNGGSGQFLALSGGKDSAACAGLLVEHGMDVPWAYMHTAFNLPDTPTTVAAIGDRFETEVNVAEPAELSTHIRSACQMFKTALPKGPASAWTEWDLLRSFPANVDVLATRPNDSTERLKAAGARARLLRVVAAGNMLVAYAYATGATGTISGLRAAESKGRRWRAIKWGAHHTYKLDGQTMSCPIQWWSGDDVFAYLVSNEIPIHPYYQAAYEYFNGTTPPEHLRVDLTLVSEEFAARGSLAAIESVYPNHVRQLAAVRPEILRYL